MYDLQANLERVVRLASTTLHSEFGKGAAPTGLLFNDFRTPWDLSLASQIVGIFHIPELSALA